MYFASDLAPSLNDRMLGLVGEGTLRGGSGLAILGKVLVPYFGRAGSADADLLTQITKPKSCKDIHSLYVMIDEWDSKVSEYLLHTGKSAIDDDILELALKSMYEGIESMVADVDNLRENWAILTPSETLSYNDIHSFVKSKALKVYQKDLDNPKPKAPKPPPPPNTPKANMAAAGGTGVPVINAILNPNMSDCIDWQLDGCKWGDMCRFKHDPSTKGKGRENGLTERLAAMAAKPCFDFKAGTRVM